MIISADIVIQSHLSDAMIEMGIQQEIYQQQAQERLRFVKYLISKFPDTNEKIDVDAIYEEFTLKSKR